MTAQGLCSQEASTRRGAASGVRHACPRGCLRPAQEYTMCGHKVDALLHDLGPREMGSSFRAGGQGPPERRGLGARLKLDWGVFGDCVYKQWNTFGQNSNQRETRKGKHSPKFYPREMTPDRSISLIKIDIKS